LLETIVTPVWTKAERARDDVQLRKLGCRGRAHGGAPLGFCADALERVLDSSLPGAGDAVAPPLSQPPEVRAELARVAQLGSALGDAQLVALDDVGQGARRSRNETRSGLWKRTVSTVVVVRRPTCV
jgi:hypothetical protein